MTVEEYVAWADAQSERQRTELINGQIVAMAPERVEHNRMKLAVAIALRGTIASAGLPCEALVDGLGVRIDEHTVYEPDAIVYCGEKLARGSMIVPNPVIIVEVLSPTTKHTDTSAKLIGYFKLPSVAHYLVIDPDRMTVTHHARERAPDVFTEGTIRLDPPGVQVAVGDLLGAASS